MTHPSKFITSLLAACLIAQVYGDIPKKPPLTRYTGLWTNSPFTSKPPPATATAVDDPFADFTLTGIAPVPGGYRITIVNKKKPEDKHVIEPGGSSNFKLVSVSRNPDVALGTKVTLSAGGTQGTVGFEPDLISPKVAPPAASPIAAKEGQQPSADSKSKDAKKNTDQKKKTGSQIVPSPNGPNTPQGNTLDSGDSETRLQRRTK